jgi:hypothetical protein
LSDKFSGTFLFKRRFAKPFSGHLDESRMATLDDKKGLRRISAIDGFRPLTDEEKQQFLESLDGKGRRILAELAGKAATDPQRDEPGDIVQLSYGRAACRLP